MSGFTKRIVDKFISDKIKYWVFDLGRNAHLYLQKELKISTNDKESLTDDDKKIIKDFQHNVTKSVIVTGGCFTSMLQGDQPNDIDVYFNNKEIAVLVSTFYINRMIANGNLTETPWVPKIDVNESGDGVHILVKSQGVSGDGIDTAQYRYFEQYPDAATDDFFKQYRKNTSNASKDDKKNAYEVSFLTSNAITLYGDIQIIVRFVGDVEEIHSNFDFIHATNYWTWDDGVVYNSEALAATLEKRLYYFGSKFPVATIFRMRKFIERGWRISAGEMLKICYDISHLDLDDIQVLKEQSIGMDSAYFSQVIQALQERRMAGDNTEIDRTYLFHVIDIAFRMHDKKDKWLTDNSEEKQPEELLF